MQQPPHPAPYREEIHKGRRSGGVGATSRCRFGMAALPYLCLLPATLLVSLLILYPIAITFVNSFYAIGSLGERRTFTGLRDYAALLADGTFRQVLWQTCFWTGTCVGGTVLLSLGLALMLHHPFPGRRLARSIVILPWAAPLTMSSVTWWWIFNSDYGILNQILVRVGLFAPGQAPPWLAVPKWAWTAILTVGIWASIPFTTVVLLAGLQAIPPDLYEAARIDGAGWRAALHHITLPLLRPMVAIATMLNVIYVFNSFPIIWILTEGKPMNTTDTLITYLYKMAFQYGDFGTAFRLAVITFLLLLAFSLVYVRLQYREEGWLR